MSRQFNDTTNNSGLMQMYELEINKQFGDVSGNTTRKQQFTAYTRSAWDSFLQLAFSASGTYQYDDSNQTDYPIITTNLVANQRDYALGADGSGNLILEIYKVFVANSSGVFSELLPVDVNTGNDGSPGGVAASGNLYPAPLSTFTDGRNTTGTPLRYDKLGNAVFLDPIPNYNSTNGLKFYINREPLYFASTDTTKKPGVPGDLQDYFFLKPAADYLRVFGTEKQYQKTFAEVLRMEAKIVATFSERVRDERPRLTPAYENNQ